jgi:hypothetical protein
LPSNTETAGNRSQMSHISIESLSQLYNTNLRLKFGSAPAQLLTVGREAEMSIEKRTSAIKKQFQITNDVSSKSQVSQNLSKQAMHGGTISSTSWMKKDEPSVVTLGTGDNRQKMSHIMSSNRNKKIMYDEVSDDSDDDDENLVIGNKGKNKNRDDSRYSSGRISGMTSPSSFQLK